MHYKDDYFECVVLIRVGSLGDIVISSIATEIARNKFLNSKIVFVLAQRYKDLLDHNKNVDFLLEFDDRNFFKGFLQILKIRRQLSKTVNLVVDLHPAYWSPARSSFWVFVLRWLLPAKCRIKVKKKNFSLIVKDDSDYRKNHLTKDIVNLLSEIKPPSNGSGQAYRYAFAIQSNGVFSGIRQERSSGWNIGIHPGASFQTKRWPVENFIDLCRKVVLGANCQITLFGGEKEKDLIVGMAKELAAIEVNVYLALGLPISQVLKLIQSMDLFISNDTGLMHLAAAHNIPTISIFGPTHPKLGFYPLGTKSSIFYSDITCSPCSKWGEKRCRYDKRECFSSTTVEHVLDRVHLILGETNVK